MYIQSQHNTQLLNKGPNTPNIGHCNKCELYIHVRKMSQNKIMIFQHAYSNLGWWVARTSSGSVFSLSLCLSQTGTM